MLRLRGGAGAGNAAAAPMEAEPEPQVPLLPPPSAQDAPLLMHMQHVVPDFSGHRLSHAMWDHQAGMLLRHTVDQLGAKSGQTVHVLTASINSLLAAFQAANEPHGPYQLYQDVGELIEYVTGEVADAAACPVVLAWDLAPGQVASLAHKLAVLAAANVAFVPLVSAVDMPAREVTNEVSLLSHVQTHYGSHVSLATRAVVCLDPCYGRQSPHGRGLQYYRKLLVQMQPEALLPRERRQLQGYNAMAWVRSPALLCRQPSVQIRITVANAAWSWAQRTLSEFKQKVRREDADVSVTDVAPTQLRHTIGRLMPRRFKTVAVHITPLRGQLMWLVQQLRDTFVQAGHGFWYDYADDCPKDVCFSPVTVDADTAIHAVGVAARRWAAADATILWDLPSRSWLVMADPSEHALQFAEDLRSVEDRALRFRRPVNWRLSTRVSLHDRAGLNCTIWAVSQLDDPSVVEYQLSPLTPGEIMYLQEERREHFPRSKASFTATHVLDADGQPVGAAVLRVKSMDESVPDDFHQVLKTCLQQGVFEWRGVRCELAHYAGCSEPSFRIGARLGRTDVRQDLWAWEQQARPGQRHHMHLPPMVRLQPMPSFEAAGKEHGNTTLPCRELAVFLGPASIGLRLPASSTPHAKEQPLLTYAADHPPQLPWQPCVSQPESTLAQVETGLRGLGHEVVTLPAENPFLRGLFACMLKHGVFPDGVPARPQVAISVSQRSVPRNVLFRLPLCAIEAIFVWMPGREGLTLRPLDDNSFVQCPPEASGAFEEDARYSVQLHSARQLLALGSMRSWRLRGPLLGTPSPEGEACARTYTGRSIIGYVLKAQPPPPQRAPAAAATTTFQDAYVQGLPRQSGNAPETSAGAGPSGGAASAAGASTTAAAAGGARPNTGHQPSTQRAPAAPACTTLMTSSMVGSHEATAESLAQGVEILAGQAGPDAAAETALVRPFGVGPDAGRQSSHSGDALPNACDVPAQLTAMASQNVVSLLASDLPGDTAGRDTPLAVTVEELRRAAPSESAAQSSEPIATAGQDAMLAPASTEHVGADHRDVQNADVAVEWPGHATATGSGQTGNSLPGSAGALAPTLVSCAAAAEAPVGSLPDDGGGRCRGNVAAGAERAEGQIGSKPLDAAGNHVAKLLCNFEELGTSAGLADPHAGLWPPLPAAVAAATGNEVQEEVSKRVSAYLHRPLEALRGTEGACFLRSVAHMLHLPEESDGNESWQVFWYLLCSAWLLAGDGNDNYAERGAQVALEAHPYWSEAMRCDPALSAAAIVIWQFEGILANCMAHPCQYTTDTQVVEAAKLVQAFYGHQILVVNSTVSHADAVDALSGVLQPEGVAITDRARMSQHPFLLLRFYDHYITGHSTQPMPPLTVSAFDTWFSGGCMGLRALLGEGDLEASRANARRWVLTELARKRGASPDPPIEAQCKRPLCVWSVCGRARVWEHALKRLGEDWVVGVESEVNDTIRAIVAKMHGLPQSPSTNMYRKPDGKLVAYPGDALTLFADGGRPLKQLLRRCPFNALHLVLQATPSCDLRRTRFKGEFGWCGPRSVLLHSGLVLQELLRHHAPDTALVVAVGEHAAELADQPLFANYLADVTQGEVSYLDTGQIDLLASQRAWVSPFGFASKLEVPAAHSGVQSGWVPCGVVLAHAADIVGPDLGETLVGLLRDTNGVSRVVAPTRVHDEIPTRYRCIFHSSPSLIEFASAESEWQFAGQTVLLASHAPVSDLGAVVLRAFSSPTPQRSWWAVPARRYEGCLLSASVALGGAISDGSVLFDPCAYRAQSLVQRHDEWGEPIPCDWSAFDRDFPDARRQFEQFDSAATTAGDVTKSLQPAMRILHRRDVTDDWGVRPVGLHEYCRLTGLQIPPGQFADQCVAVLLKRATPVLQLTRVLQGTGPDHSLHAALHGRWVPSQSGPLVRAQLAAKYAVLLQHVRGRPQAKAPFARTCPTPLPRALWEEYLAADSSFRQPCDDELLQLDPVPAYDAESLPARRVAAEVPGASRPSQGTKRGAAAASTSHRPVAARVSGEPHQAGSDAAASASLAGSRPVTAPIVSGSNAGELAGAQPFGKGMEYSADMSGLMVALGAAMRVDERTLALSAGYAWVRERYPALWHGDLFEQHFAFQCWLAISVWQEREPPAVYFSEATDDRNIIGSAKCLLRGVGSQAVLLCQAPQKRLRVWVGPTLPGLGVVVGLLLPPAPDGLYLAIPPLRLCSELAMYPLEMGAVAARKHPHNLLFMAVCTLGMPKLMGSGVVPQGGGGFTRFVNQWMEDRPVPRASELHKLGELLRSFVRHISAAEVPASSQSKRPTACAEIISHTFDTLPRWLVVANPGAAHCLELSSGAAAETTAGIVINTNSLYALWSTPRLHCSDAQLAARRRLSEGLLRATQSA